MDIKQNNKQQNFSNSKWKKSIITQSINSKLLILEYQKIQNEIVKQIQIIKIINLDGQWPNFPCIIQRKNQSKQRQFIIINQNNKTIQKFLEESINHLLILSQIQNKNLISKQQKAQLPNQLYISNFGNRISFWLSQQNFKILGTIPQIAQCFSPFRWLRKSDNIITNEIQYVEFYSLRSMINLLSLGQYNDQEQKKQINQYLHNATSIVNYNYRYFYPPKNATKFLKKTCSIQILTLQKFAQKKSSLWAQDILLKNLFQIRPSIFLCQLICKPNGPIYLKNYIFSQYFYQQIQKVYYLGKIGDYFNKYSLRDQLKHFIYISRLYPDYYFTLQGKKYFSNIKLNFDKTKLLCTESKEIQYQKKLHKSQQLTLIQPIFQLSNKYFTKKLIEEFQKIQTTIINIQPFLQNHSNQLQRFIKQQKQQIHQLNQFCQNYELNQCNKCSMFMYKLNINQNKIQQLFNMFNLGSDQFCIHCNKIYQLENALQKNQINQKKEQIQQSYRQKLIDQRLYLRIDTQSKLFKIVNKLNQKQNIIIKSFLKPLNCQIVFYNLLHCVLSQKNQSTIYISQDQLHDSFQLSKISGLLTSSNYLNKDYLNIYNFYYQKMLKLIAKLKQNNQKKQYLISSIWENLKILQRKKYQNIELNTINKIIEKSLIKSQNNNQLALKVIDYQIQRKQLNLKIKQFLKDELLSYSLLIKQNYRIFKQKMNSQYKVTAMVLKQMIAQFQLELKQNIKKSTKQILYDIKWILLFISNYAEVKYRKIIYKQIQIKKQQFTDQLTFFVNQIDLILQICVLFIQNCNQPGQSQLTEQIQKIAINFIQIFIQGQYYLKQSNKQQFNFDFETISVLILSKIETLVLQKLNNLKQDAKKLIQKHFDKFKQFFNQKLKYLKSYSNKEEFIKNINIHKINIVQKSIKKFQLDELTQKFNTFDLNIVSSYFYQEGKFLKKQSNYVTNDQIKIFFNLISSITNKSWRNQSLQIRSKNQQTQKIKIGIIYKIISDTLIKPQIMQQIVNLFQYFDKVLINTINYMISQTFQQFQNKKQQMIDNLELYFQREKYYYYSEKKQNTKNYKETKQILNFLFQNRMKFFYFNQQSQENFERHYHMLIQIMILNTFPLFQIQLAYKTQFKDIGKKLKTFQLSEDCSTQGQTQYVKRKKKKIIINEKVKIREQLTKIKGIRIKQMNTSQIQRPFRSLEIIMKILK